MIGEVASLWVATLKTWSFDAFDFSSRRVDFFRSRPSENRYSIPLYFEILDKEFGSNCKDVEKGWSPETAVSDGMINSLL